jgi:thioredoxin reductase
MRYDVVVIGGSFAGLSAAMYLARARRSVCIIDTGSPRNRFAAHSHGFFGHDGGEPLKMVALAREQVGRYPTATFVDGEAVAATTAGADGFTVTLAGGGALDSSRLVLAFGISDELPVIPGLPERWGTSVLHCPYCHGFEFSGRQLAVLNLSPRSVEQAMLIAEWGPTTLLLNGASLSDETWIDRLRQRGVTIEPASVRALVGKGTALSGGEFENGRTIPVDALYIGPRTRLNSTIGEQLGCQVEAGVLGPIITTDPQKMTTVIGVYAAGDITRAAHNVTWASADGVTAGLAVHRSLVF